MTVTVVGSVNLDHIMKVSKFPKPGETSVAKSYKQVSGGKGANQAIAVARMESEVNFIACVGDDNFGNDTLSFLEKENINTTTIKQIKNTATGVALIYINDAGENIISISAEANSHLLAENIINYKNIISNSDYLLLQLETPICGVLEALQIARNTNTITVLNPAPANEHLTDELLALVDIITPNETESEILTGILPIDDSSCQEVANILHSKGIKTIIITLGDKGVWLSEAVNTNQGTGQRIKVAKTKVIDTTAAGDTFNGALVSSLDKGIPLTKAITFANYIASISVTKLGAQSSIPKLSEINVNNLENLS